MKDNSDAVLGIMKYNKMIQRQFLEHDVGYEHSHKINYVKGNHEKISRFLLHTILYGCDT